VSITDKGVYKKKRKIQSTQQINVMICNSTYAIACPSEVDVPRPSSSKTTREFLVADDWSKSYTAVRKHTSQQINACHHTSKEELTSTEAVSMSSTKNVLWPAII
jgi:hypothetical protein